MREGNGNKCWSHGDMNLILSLVLCLQVLRLLGKSFKLSGLHLLSFKMETMTNVGVIHVLYNPME